VRLDHIAMEMQENSSCEAIKNEEEVTFGEKDIHVEKAEDPFAMHQTDEDVKKEEKYLIRKKNPEDDAEDTEQFSNGEKESKQERCSIGEEMSTEDNSRFEEKCPIEKKGRNEKMSIWRRKGKRRN